MKFGVYKAELLLFEGEAEEIGLPEASFWSRAGADDDKQEKHGAIADHASALEMALRVMAEAGHGEFASIGHRVVHGGADVRDHVRLNGKVLEALRRAIPFAPLHLPASLAVIDAVSKRMPQTPQVICLDTAFHKDLPDVSKTLPFPSKVRDMGIQRYGFHGLSVESIVEQLAHVRKRTVVAHLGNGASVTALHDGKSIDTSMGLTPAGGVMMGTRCGDTDPGVLLFLLRSGMDAAELETITDQDAGLEGVSEKTSDVRELTAARKTDAKSDLALRMFAYQVKKAIGGMAAALGGLDELIFTGGIGEHAQAVRDEICSGMGFLGQYSVKVLPSEEDLQIARIAHRLLPGSS